jgi:hypothetical protein
MEDHSMGRLAHAPFEARLAVTLFLLLLGVSDLFGAWQVANFASFSPAGVARTVEPPESHPAGPAGGSGERPVSLAEMDEHGHHVTRELLVQDTHVHVPVYALTAALLSLVVLGLELRSRFRTLLVALLFGAPAADFVGLWGAHLAPAGGAAWGALAVAGGFAMGLGYTIVLVIALKQCWLSQPHKETPHA